jgi:hypothetical protein
LSITYLFGPQQAVNKTNVRIIGPGLWPETNKRILSCSSSNLQIYFYLGISRAGRK